MAEVQKSERQVDLVNGFIEYYNAENWDLALEAAERTLSEFPSDGTTAVYKTVCLDMLGRTEEASAWRQSVSENISDYQMSADEQVKLSEQEAEIELSRMYRAFSGRDEEFDAPFPVSREEYSKGKHHFQQAWDLHVGSADFEKRYKRAKALIQKAEGRYFLGSNLIWMIGTALAPICLIAFITTRDPAWVYGTVYYTLGSVLYRIGSKTPGYLLAKRMVEQQKLQAVNGAMFDTFSRTQNKRYRVHYTDGSVETHTGSQQLQVGITFLIMKIGFFFFRVVAITWIGLFNLLRNRA